MINQLSQALSSIRKLTQIGAVTTITTGCMYMERFGVNSFPFIFPYTSYQLLYTVQYKVSSYTLLLGIFEFYSVLPYSLTPFRRCVWLFGIGG